MDQLTFWNECRDFSIAVPDFKKLSDTPLSDLSIFRMQGLFQDPDQSYVLNALPSIKIPDAEDEFHQYIDRFLQGQTQRTKPEPDVPYILHEFINGHTFVVNLICKDGIILFVQV